MPVPRAHRQRCRTEAPPGEPQHKSNRARAHSRRAGENRTTTQVRQRAWCSARAIAPIRKPPLSRAALRTPAIAAIKSEAGSERCCTAKPGSPTPGTPPPRRPRRRNMPELRLGKATSRIALCWVRVARVVPRAHSGTEGLAQRLPLAHASAGSFSAVGGVSGAAEGQFQLPASPLKSS